MSYRLTPQAQADIDEIAFYIAADNPNAAWRWVDRVEAQCRSIAEHPGLGPARPQVMPGLRIFPLGRYLILYRQVTDGVEIIRVVHVARDWRSLIDNDEG